jgi:hypothetical protein
MPLTTLDHRIYAHIVTEKSHTCCWSSSTLSKKGVYKESGFSRYFDRVRKLTSSSSPARGLEGLDGGGMLWEGARRGGISETRDMRILIVTTAQMQARSKINII